MFPNLIPGVVEGTFWIRKIIRVNGESDEEAAGKVWKLWHEVLEDLFDTDGMEPGLGDIGSKRALLTIILLILKILVLFLVLVLVVRLFHHDEALDEYEDEDEDEESWILGEGN